MTLLANPSHQWSGEGSCPNEVEDFDALRRVSGCIGCALNDHEVSLESTKNFLDPLKKLIA